MGRGWARVLSRASNALIYKKLISKVGETIDLAGKAIVGLATITSKPGHLGDLASVSTGQWTLFAVGAVVVAVGIYFQAEAKR
jgi:hypothetical protein